jgi:hypothetical protein
MRQDGAILRLLACARQRLHIARLSLKPDNAAPMSASQLPGCRQPLELREVSPHT